jgi:hypothetical protein
MIRPMRRATAAAALAAVIGATTSGCKRQEPGGQQRAIVELATVPDAGVHGVRGADDAATTLIPLTHSWPDDFPADIPIYPDAGFTLGGRSTAAGKPTWSVTVETEDSKEQVLSEYRRMFGAFAMLSELEMGLASLSVWRNDSYDVILTIGRGADAKTTVTLNVSQR